MTHTCAELGCDVQPLLMASGQFTGRQAVESWEPRGAYSSLLGLALLWSIFIPFQFKVGSTSACFGGCSCCVPYICAFVLV